METTDLIYTGVLGDPAKINHYDEQFYEIPNYFDPNTLFYLLGASEKHVKRSDIKKMYNRLIIASEEQTNLDSIKSFGNLHNNDFRSRIGLFPSSINQLIKGPQFIFAPYPINTKKKRLQFLSKSTINILKKINWWNLLPLGYFPLGGKAGKRTAANLEISKNRIYELFYEMRFNKWLKLFYLEAGSGSKFLSSDFIQKVLEYQAKAILNININDNLDNNLHLKPNLERIIIPNSIYGGGINSINIVDKLLKPTSEIKLVPEFVIIGNISENNITQTYNIIDRINELNEISSFKLLSNQF